MKIGFATDIKNLDKNRGLNIPTNSVSKLSESSSATDCFVRQQFSNELQVYLINYVFNITSYYDQNG